MMNQRPYDEHDSSLSNEAHARLARFKAYATSHTVLSEVAKQLKRDIAEPAGFAYVLLYGPSGVGKTTLIRQVERTHNVPPRMLETHSPYLPVPLLLLETRPPDGATFNRSEYYRSALRQLGEQTYERRTLVNIDEEHVWGHKPDRGKGAKFHDSSELRHIYEAALQRRGVRTIILDEAQHLLKLASGIKLIDQLDWIKSMSNTTGVLHILTGTYELLAMRRLNGQSARRGLELHFPRYHYQHQPDREAFQSALATLLSQIPLETDIGTLVQYWPYFYERSIGCIGVLKDWLVRAVAATLADGSNKLVLEKIQECALSLAQCESMAMEATAGEQELHYTASQRQHLWKLLGMSETSAPPAAPSDPSPTPLPHVGTQHPVRHQVGAPKDEKPTGNCPFSGTSLAITPAQLQQSGVAKVQCPECGAIWTARIKGENVFFPTHQTITRKRAQNIAHWIKQSMNWVLMQAKK